MTQLIGYLSWLYSDFPNQWDFLIGISLFGVLLATLLVDSVIERMDGRA